MTLRSGTNVRRLRCSIHRERKAISVAEDCQYAMCAECYRLWMSAPVIHLLGHGVTLCGRAIDEKMTLLRPYAEGAEGPAVCTDCREARR